MAEETTQGAAEAAATPDASGPHGTGQDGGERDWKAEYDKLLADSRKWEDRAKKNAAAAKELDELKARSMTDAERAEAAERRAAEAEAKVAEYERRDEVRGIVAQVAAEKGVDAEVLAEMGGTDRESVEAKADLLAKAYGDLPKYPSVADRGQQRPAKEKTDYGAIKDPAQRVRARAADIARSRR